MGMEYAILETRFHARARLGFDLGREEIETRTSPLDLSVDLRRFREQPVARPLVGNPLRGQRGRVLVSVSGSRDPSQRSGARSLLSARPAPALQSFPGAGAQVVPRNGQGGLRHLFRRDKSGSAAGYGVAHATAGRAGGPGRRFLSDVL